MEQCSRRGGLKKRLYGRSQVRRVLLAKINHTCHLAVRLFTIPRRLRWREHISSARTAAAAREMKCNKNMLTCHFTTAHNYQNKCVHTSFFKKTRARERRLLLPPPPLAAALSPVLFSFPFPGFLFISCFSKIKIPYNRDMRKNYLNITLD